MRPRRRAAVISPTIEEDGLQVFVLGQTLDDLEGGLLEDPAPQVGEEVQEAAGDQELVEPQRNDLQEEPAGSGDLKNGQIDGTG